MFVCPRQAASCSRTSAAPIEHGEIESTQIAFTIREFGGGMVSANNVGQSLSHGERLRAGTFEIEIELGVGIVRFKQFDELQRQRGFANAAQPCKPEMVTPPTSIAVSNSCTSSSRPVKSAGGGGTSWACVNVSAAELEV